MKHMKDVARLDGMKKELLDGATDVGCSVKLSFTRRMKAVITKVSMPYCYAGLNNSPVKLICWSLRNALNLTG